MQNSYQKQKITSSLLQTTTVNLCIDLNGIYKS